MSKSIPISPKHGVNPSMILCPKCGESHSIALMGKLKNDAEAPRAIIGAELCDSCLEESKQSKRIMVFCIEGESMTGELLMVSEEAFPHIFGKDYPQGRAVFLSSESFSILKRHAEEANKS